jgi:hypothetical protein
MQNLESFPQHNLPSKVIRTLLNQDRITENISISESRSLNRSTPCSIVVLPPNLVRKTYCQEIATLA